MSVKLLQTISELYEFESQKDVYNHFLNLIKSFNESIKKEILNDYIFNTNYIGKTDQYIDNQNKFSALISERKYSDFIQKAKNLNLLRSIDFEYFVKCFESFELCYSYFIDNNIYYPKTRLILTDIANFINSKIIILDFIHEINVYDVLTKEIFYDIPRRNDLLNQQYFIKGIEYIEKFFQTHSHSNNMIAKPYADECLENYNISYIKKGILLYKNEIRTGLIKDNIPSYSVFSNYFDKAKEIFHLKEEEKDYFIEIVNLLKKNNTL